MKYDIILGEYLQNKPIEGIKCLRLEFNLGLYDAKMLFDDIRSRGRSMELTPENVMNFEAIGFIVISENERQKLIQKEVTVYITEESIRGRKIEAIKKLRVATRLGLKEAKDVMDEMWRYHRPIILKNHIKVTDKVVQKLIEQGFTVTGYVHECFKGQEDLFTI